MKRLQFRVLYREFLFRIVDLELLSAHAEGDSRTLLGQFASLLVFLSVILGISAGLWASHIKNDPGSPLAHLMSAWGMQHFLIATTMLVVGLFAVLSWESTYPDRRDVLVLGPLPVQARTLFLAKVAAVATALGLTLASLHVVAGIAWPLALGQFDATPLVRAAGPVRSFFAYWITMAAAGVFTFCCVLGLQGFAAQLLPRRWFLRASTFLQLAVFCLFVVGYFLQRSPARVLVAGPKQPGIAWIPSYWFVGLYQQLSGSLHPALTPFARRAWIGLAAAICATAIAYAVSYLRTLRKIVEEPDIVPGFKNVHLPRLGGSFESAVAQFSIRSLFRSRQHRMIFAFYMGVALAFALLFLTAPREISGPGRGDPWHQPSVPLLASSIVIMGFWVAGARVVFSLPLDLRANWIFRVMPFRAGRQCLGARRRAIFALSVAPAWTISAAALFVLWPWRLAAVHLFLLGCFGIVLAEFSFDGAQKIPFTCSYLPGRSHIHITFLFWIYVLVGGLVAAAVSEIKALASPAASAALLAGLGIAALFAILRNNWLARPGQAELRFEEEPPDQLTSLNLSWGGYVTEPADGKQPRAT